MSARRLPPPLAILTGFALLALAALYGARLFLGREAEDRLSEGEIADFSDLAAHPATSRFLMCPPATCNVPPNAASPVFDVPWETLRDDWSEIVGRQPRVKLLAGDGDLGKITYIQHSALLRLPRIVTIQFVPLGDKRSSFALVSQSRYPWPDLGANTQLVLTWVRGLDHVVNGHGKSGAP